MPIQLAQCWFPGLAISNVIIYIFFQIINTEAILSNSTRKLLRFEIAKMLIAVLKKQTYCVILYNYFRHTFVGCANNTERDGDFYRSTDILDRRPCNEPLHAEWISHYMIRIKLHSGRSLSMDIDYGCGLIV